VARRERPFSQDERELFAYLAGQAAVSIENVDLHELVQRQAVTDELTGLSNDIDHFKAVSDTYGHQQGDLVLREVAHVLRDSSREIDEPARYGGEERRRRSGPRRCPGRGTTRGR